MTTLRHKNIVDRIRHLLMPLLAITLAFPAIAQPVSPTPTPTPGSDAKTADAPPPSDEDTIALSPFEVSAGKQSGYYAANTLAGTRLNNNIADLPSSVTVITKQQLEDTNSLSLNDIFRYEANTEGASTYTPFSLVRTNLSDGLGGGGGTTGNYTSAATSGNRVRGLSAVDIDVDNFFSISRIPFDAYNTDSIEILRGPNSIIFGTGSPSGIVNQERTQADAHPTQITGDAEVMAKSFGGERESLGINIPLIKDRLAIYVGQLYDSEGFAQKPSADITRRQYGSITLYPFKSGKTKLTASVERYSNYANDPNGITPVDFVTPWKQSGEPVWNPLTDTVSYQTGTNPGGVYALSSAYPNYSAPRTQALLTTTTSPYFVPSLTFESASHYLMLIDQGNLENFFKTSQTGFSVPGYVPALGAQTTAGKLVNEDRLTLSTNLPHPAIYANWYDPTVSSKSVYDWSSVNINSLNNTSTRATTYNVNLQQEIFTDLNAQVSFFRQDLKQLQDAPLNQANATTLYVDTNSYLPNGTPNPHLGQPFVDVYQGDVYSEPETNTNYRAMLTYDLDLRNKGPKWLSWLGHHRFLGLYTRHDDVQSNLRFRPAIDAGDPNYLPTTAVLNQSAGYSYATNGGSDAIEQWVYLGGPKASAPGQGTSSPGSYNRPNFGGATSTNIQTYNYATGQWVTSSVNMDSLLFNTGGLAENLQNSETFYWQGFLWDDRIVGSFGVNQDTVKNRNTVFPSALSTLYTNGLANTQYWNTYGPWANTKGTTHSAGVVFHAFKDWAGLDHAADTGNYFAAALRTLSFTANRSSNFNPPPANFTDYFGNPLGVSQGKETDFGVEVATPDNKLFLRVTRFHTTNQNAIVTLTSTARANYIDANELKAWATKVVDIRNGQDPTSVNFGSTTIYPVTTAEQNQIAALMGLPYTYGGNVGANGEYVNPASTENGIAKGIEAELTYNPLKNWTMKLTFGQQNTTVTGAGAQAQAWVNTRMPLWNPGPGQPASPYVAPDLNPAGYTLSNGTHLYLNNFWNAVGYDSNVTSNSASGWTTTANYYNLVVGSQLATDEANNGAAAPNQREYTWTYLTNYTIDRGALKHLSFGGALRYDGRAEAGYYANTSDVNSNGVILAPDISRPIYTPGKYHIDAWVAYTLRLPFVRERDSHFKLQFNVADLTSNGYLLPVSYNWDGTAAAYRIIQPRTFTLSAKYDF